MNNDLNSFCNFVCASKHVKSFVLRPEEELYIKDQWARQFEEEMDAHEDKGNHSEKKILNHIICRPNVLINMQHVLMLDLHDTCDLHDTYDLHNLVLVHVTFCVPKSLMHDSLIRGIHDESVMLHGNSIETYMEHETLGCFNKWIGH